MEISEIACYVTTATPFVTLMYGSIESKELRKSILWWALAMIYGCSVLASLEASGPVDDQVDPQVAELFPDRDSMDGIDPIQAENQDHQENQVTTNIPSNFVADCPGELTVLDFVRPLLDGQWVQDGTGGFVFTHHALTRFKEVSGGKWIFEGHNAYFSPQQ